MADIKTVTINDTVYDIKDQTARDDISDLKSFFITPQDYGAKGDGVTDDTQSIQNCINDCYETGKYKIFFPRGTYLVTSPIVLPFTHNPFWAGRGITIQGEHQGNTTIKKTGSNTYKNVDTVLFCECDNTSYTSGTAISVFDLRIENQSETALSYCINGDAYCRGEFKRLYLIGKYGIKCQSGFNNIFDDIIGETSETFFEDGGTSTRVGKIGCFGSRNPYILKSNYGTYDLLFGDNCIGVFLWAYPYGTGHINMIGSESPNLDCVVQSGAIQINDYVEAQARTFSIDNVFCNNLTTAGSKYLVIKEGRLQVDSITITYANAPVATTLCYFDSTLGCCQIGEVSNISAAANFNSSLFTLVSNQGEKNKLYFNTSEYTGYYGSNKLLYLGGLQTTQGIGETSMRNKMQSVVMGGYLDATAQYGEYKNANAETQRWLPMPPSGSLVLNDIKKSNVGVAGFISLRAESGGAWDNLISNKAPIPIMYTCQESQVPSDALKNGTVLFNTSTNKLEVYYNNAWVVIGS